MTTPNRIMRCNKNPAGRGFVVSVQEEVARHVSPGGDVLSIQFRVIASSTHGTRKAADKAYDALRAEYIAA